MTSLTRKSSIDFCNTICKEVNILLKNKPSMLLFLCFKYLYQHLRCRCTRKLCNRLSEKFVIVAMDLRQKKLPRLFHRNINEHIERELLMVLSRYVLPSRVLCFAELNFNVVLVYTLFYFPFCTHGAKSSTFRSDSTITCQFLNTFSKSFRYNQCARFFFNCIWNSTIQTSI